MSVIFDMLLGNLAPILAVVAAVLGLFGINLYGRRQARKEAWREAETADLKNAIKKERKANEVNEYVSGLSDDERRRLREASPARRGRN